MINRLAYCGKDSITGLKSFTAHDLAFTQRPDSIKLTAIRSSKIVCLSLSAFLYPSLIFTDKAVDLPCEVLTFIRGSTRALPAILDSGAGDSSHKHTSLLQQGTNYCEKGL